MTCTYQSLYYRTLFFVLYIFNFFNIITDETNTCVVKTFMCCKRCSDSKLRNMYKNLNNLDPDKTPIKHQETINFKDLEEIKNIKIENPAGSIKPTDILDVNEWFKIFNDSLYDEYTNCDDFNYRFWHLRDVFVKKFKNKTQYDIWSVDQYLTIEGTVKIPNNMSIEDFRNNYISAEYEKVMYNLIRNCIKNKLNFRLYLDNLNKNGKYYQEVNDNEDYNHEPTKPDLGENKAYLPRNPKINKIITRFNYEELFDKEIKGKEVIILYNFGQMGEYKAFTTKD